MKKKSSSFSFFLRILTTIVMLSTLNSCNKYDEVLLIEFEQFWFETKDELDKIPIIGDVVGTKYFGEKSVQLIRIKSYAGIHFYAWVAEPIEDGAYPAKIQFSNFSSGNTDWNLFPHDSFMMEENTINVKVDIRGQGLSTEQISFENYLSNGNASKETYIYRGAFMDAVRVVDYIVSKSKSNGNILTLGGSQGGLLSIVAATLHKDVAVCIANYPFFADVSIYEKDGWVMNEIKEGIGYQQALKLLRYFDAKNFAKMLRVPYFSHTGEEDDVTPLKGVQLVYEFVDTGEKELYIAPCQGHGCSSSSEIAIQKQQAFIKHYYNED